MNTSRTPRRGLALALALVLLAALQVLVGTPARAATTLPPGFLETRLPGTLSFPASMAFAPDGRLFVGDRQGALRVYKNDALLPTPALQLTVSTSGERGLVGITFDPAFATNGWIYLYYTATTPTIHNRLSRFTVTGDVADPASELVLLDLDDLVSNQHNAGALAFGADGRLYVAVGDNYESSNAQTLANLKGKVLRLNKDGSIPTDNPFYTAASGRNRAIWTLGLRNPFTMSVQPGTGRMYVDDVGNVTYEEINEVVGGSNYGWPTTEGPTTDPRFRAPLYAYPHGSGLDAGCAITGGTFYSPASPTFPAAYLGKYFFIDYCNMWIKTYDPSTGGVSTFASDFSTWNTVYVTTAPNGSLYYMTTADPNGVGAIYRISYSGSSAPQIGDQPSSVTVTAGDSATFTVNAYGAAPLSYQWLRGSTPIPGATSASYNTGPLTTADDGSTYAVSVSNGLGSTTSTSATLTVVDNAQPVVTLSAPAEGTTYRGGDVLPFAASASDPEDGPLPASAFAWQVDLHHNVHVHPGVATLAGASSGTFTVPTTGETSTSVFYRITATVTDSAGRTATAYRDVRPVLSQISLRTNLSTASLGLDGQPVAAPYDEATVVGVQRTLSAPPTQTVAGKIYRFVSWSDGGAATHVVSPPDAPTTYTASYALQTSGTIAVAPNPVYQGDGTGLGVVTATWSTSGTTDVEVHLGSPGGALFARSGAGTASQTTGKWVADGTTFYLQDRTGGRPLDASGTLATARATVVKAWGAIALTPNPLTVTDGTGLGVASVSWGSNKAKVEVHVGTPTGPLLSRSGSGEWSATTGKWVRDGQAFFLQDVGTTPSTTLASVTARVRSGSITATPNPVAVTDGTGLGVTQLTWTTGGTALVEVHVGAPAGPLLSRSSAGTWSATTGKWVRDGMVFYLQDVTGGAPLDASGTLGTVAVGVTAPAAGATTTAARISYVAPTRGTPRAQPTRAAPAVSYVQPVRGGRP